MFDIDKALMKFLTPFVAILMVMICIYASIKILEHIWLEMLIIVAALGTIAGCIALVWWRFRRW